MTLPQSRAAEKARRLLLETILLGAVIASIPLIYYAMTEKVRLDLQVISDILVVVLIIRFCLTYPKLAKIGKIPVK
jgi:predicted secreted protein